ncbi:trehalose-phosphatase [Oleisolibacter albus]|uniref:trehalose-phosphatase n=1 Tax=Oleisolibacter albus TaxID=2171757 RepID=UPI000DF35EE0|nr:trehalose-phosphatase [Oleisolibacter albus]
MSPDKFRFSSARDVAQALPPPDRLALFLDVDGTLIGPTHDDREAGVPAEQLALLGRVRALTGGALAILTGRTIDMVDDMFGPLELPVGGLQGADRRLPDGRRTALSLTDRQRTIIHGLEQEIATALPGVTVERKLAGLTIVFDEDAEVAARAAAIAVRHVGTAFAVIRGRIAIDIVPPGADKGTALAIFAGETPFSGRQPVHIGDDVPDRPAFTAARRLGGFGVAVHNPVSEADYALSSHDDVWTLLDAYASLHG